MRGIPGLTNMREIAGTGGHRRNFHHPVGRAPGQDRGGTIGRRVREPALGAGDQPAGRSGAKKTRIFANHRTVISRKFVLVPRQRQIARREFI